MGWKIASAIWIAFVLAACAAQVPVPKLGALSEATRLSDREDEAFEALARFKGGGALKPPTPKTKAKMPRRGEMSSYGVTVSAALEEAFDAYIVGQTDRALAALNRAEVEAGADSRQLFEVSLLRAQVHIMTGRFDLAETDLARSAGFEQKVFGTNVNSRALRGEARFWAGDLDAAHADLARVAAATKAWRLPTAYGGPPTNLGELFNITNAQLRAYTVLAVIDLLREDFESALEWAERAEAGMVDVFYVSNHPLYGPFVPLHADAYYGRAINLAVLAAGRMVVGKDRVAAAAFFRSAHAYLDAIGFKTQKVTVDAIRAQALLAAGFDEDAAELGGSVVEQAASAGLVNILWRVEGIRGEAFLRAGRKSDAEAAFKRAQAAIDAVSGNLGTDKSKRRFGIGKEDITYRLAGLDIEKGDYLALFRDLERGRARAFVDMLTGRAVASGRETAAVNSVSRIDSKIRRLRVRNAAPAAAASGLADESRLIAERTSIVAALRTRDPELADVLSIATRDLTEIQSTLGAGEILAYTLPVRESTEAVSFLMVGRATAQIERLSITHGKLKGLLRTFKRAVFSRPDPALQKSIAAAIGRKLGIDRWGARTELFVVPSGQLYFVPWGALDISVPVAVLPTGGWLARSPKSIETGGAAAVLGDPKFFGELKQLAGARREAQRVGERYRVDPLIGPAATDEALRGKVGGGVRMLHLATHAMFDARAPLESSLALSGESGTEHLTAAELFENPIPAEVVILSACETGVGTVEAGDDFLGLARSFYLGGARTVLNSLWPVEDKGTMAFMRVFHENALASTPGHAWLSARNSLKSQGYPPSVYGAFVIGGALK